MNQAPSEQDAYLLKKCGFFIANDVMKLLVMLTISLCIHYGITGNTVVFGMFIFIMMVLLLSNLKLNRNNTCPYCGKDFFHRWSVLPTYSFSRYTKKCAHCGYKLQK